MAGEVKKRRAPQDATLRNVRAVNKRLGEFMKHLDGHLDVIKTLKTRLESVERRVGVLEHVNNMPVLVPDVDPDDEGEMGHDE